MQGEQVAKRYAGALLEIGAEQGKAQTFREQLTAVADAYRMSGVLRNAMLNPSIRLEERKAALKAVLKSAQVDPAIWNFLRLLLDKDRFRLITTIAEQYGVLEDRRAGRVRATVTSAIPLQPQERASVQDALERWTGKTVVLVETLDPELIGGAVTRLGGLVVDGSVRTQLESMRQSILAEV